MDERKKNNRIKGVIIVLSVLLAVSIAALAGTLAYNHFFGGSQTTIVTVSDNIITPKGSSFGRGQNNSKPDSDENNCDSTTDHIVSQSAKAPVNSEAGKADALSLHNKNADDNIPFSVSNMFPGDREAKYFCIRVSHKGDVVVRYHADIRPGYEKLAEVLKCRVVLPETGEVMYDGLMRDMPESLNHELKTGSSITSELYYEITAYLDPSVGNEYQKKHFIADFRWWVEETGALDSPQTGDSLNILRWLCLASGSLVVLILLVAKRRKEEHDEQY